MLLCRKLLLALVIMIAVPGVAAAQTTDSKPPEPEQTLLKPEQLDASLAAVDVRLSSDVVARMDEITRVHRKGDSPV